LGCQKDAAGGEFTGDHSEPIVTTEPAGRVITAALVVVRGPGDTVTFVRQERGPYAGWWLPILNDAGVAAYPGELIAGRLARERIAMTNLLTGETFSRPTMSPAGN
jgi:hypothetical protein